MGLLIVVSVASWIVLTVLRVLVHVFLSKGLGTRRANGHWLYLLPQIVLILLYSLLVVVLFPGFSSRNFLIMGAIWLALVLAFEFVGSLAIQKKSLGELFEGWKIWKGHIWTIVLAFHLTGPYLAKLLRDR